MSRNEFKGTIGEAVLLGGERGIGGHIITLTRTYPWGKIVYYVDASDIRIGIGGGVIHKFGGRFDIRIEDGFDLDQVDFMMEENDDYLDGEK